MYLYAYKRLLIYTCTCHVQDLQLAMEAAGGCKALTPMGSAATQLYQLLCEQGHADKDFSYVFKFLEKAKTK